MTVRVVIAEDEAIIRLDLREILEEEGYEIVGETGRGDEAVALVKEHSPDVVILDIRMPGMDGLQAAQEIAGEKLAAVLMLTAFSQRDLIEQARDAGALAYSQVFVLRRGRAWSVRPASIEVVKQWAVSPRRLEEQDPLTRERGWRRVLTVREAAEAGRHVERLAAAQRKLQQQIIELGREQDELLDRLPTT